MEQKDIEELKKAEEELKKLQNELRGVKVQDLSEKEYAEYKIKVEQVHILMNKLYH